MHHVLGKATIRLVFKSEIAIISLHQTRKKPHADWLSHAPTRNRRLMSEVNPQEGAISGKTVLAVRLTKKDTSTDLEPSLGNNMKTCTMYM